jgi:hypothetical protein
MPAIERSEEMSARLLAESNNPYRAFQKGAAITTNMMMMMMMMMMTAEMTATTSTRMPG